METKKTKKASLEGLKGIFFECGLVVGLAVLILAFSWSSNGAGSILDPISSGGFIEEIDIPITNPEDIPPPPVAVAPPAISDEILLVTNDMPITSVNLFNPENNDPIIVEPYVRPTVIVQPKDDVIDDGIDYAVVQDKPLFMEEDANRFSKWVNSKIVYPTIALENRIQGKVILSFRIAADGTLGNIKVLRGVDPALDKEAVRVVASSPAWTPGRQNNKAVSVNYTFPVNFVITE